MFRSFLTGALATILTATLLWGGCAACAQVFTPKGAASGCCDRAGKCETPAPQQRTHKHCTSSAPALQQYAQADPERALPLGLAPLDVENAAIRMIPVHLPAHPAPDPSPPDLFLLHSTLRI